MLNLLTLPRLVPIKRMDMIVEFSHVCLWNSQREGWTLFLDKSICLIFEIESRGKLKMLSLCTIRNRLFAALLVAYLDNHPLETACCQILSIMKSILERTLELRQDPGPRELAIIQSAEEILNPPKIEFEIITLSL